jgi:conjugative relaxase-like TrwC/TraI family protein
MMTVAKVTDGSAATVYYESADDYYAEDGQAPSAWWGRGADGLGLSGSVDRSIFRALLDGELLDGSRMHHGAEYSRRAATDLTFSAPKSISMQALIGGDRRLLDAHERAVARTLAYIENRLACCRRTLAGETRAAETRNLTVATFRHDLSRDADPQLHTHAVVLNITRRPDGQWRALDAAPLYAQQKLLGAFYRAELAREVQTLGYNVRLTHNDGRFELAHLSREHIEAFSNRTRAIDRQLKDLGKDRATASARERELATLTSRKGKNQIDRDELLQEWKTRSDTLGIDYTPDVARILSDAERQRRITDAVKFAIEHLAERQSLVRHEELAACALGRATGVAALSDIEAAIAANVADSTLMEAHGVYCMARAQGMERDILLMEFQGRNAVVSIVPQLSMSIPEDNLTVGQWEAAALLLSSTNRFNGVQGRAGTGKSTMLGRVRAVAESEGWQCVGLAPSAAAARALGDAKVEAQTVAAFLALGSNRLHERSLVILDEAGMVPAVDMHAIMSAVEAAGARMALIGDTQQLKAVKAGVPFAQLQIAGMATAKMAALVRQQNATLREAVAHAADGRSAEAINLLSPSIVEIAHQGPRHRTIARDYARLSPKQRESTLVLAGTRAARSALNEAIRAELGLSGTGTVVRVLQSRDLTDAERRCSQSYRPGDVVQVLKDYRSLGLSRGEVATVQAADSGIVTLRREDGRTVEWRPITTPSVSAYELVERELAVGERVRVSANDYGRNLINGDFATITGLDIERELLGLRLTDGRTALLDISRPLHVEHGYCSTVHSAQGQTCERVMIDADVRSATNSQSQFYVAISRATTEATLYTDDRELLPESVSRLDMKTAALDLPTAPPLPELEHRSETSAALS